MKIWGLVIAIVVLVFGTFLFLREPVVVPEPALEKEEKREEIIGNSVEGRDIEVYIYGPGEKELLFVGGIHGGYEWNSVLLAERFIDYLEKNQESIPANLKISVVPVLNPDGLFKVTGKEGRFSESDISGNTVPGRFNANGVDLNRNFDCEWQSTATWRSKTVSAGNKPFSEPESIAIRNYVLENDPEAVVFWHSQANTVYASGCGGDILPESRNIMNLYAEASGYNKAETFEAYVVTGDAGDWLATIGIPAITVELETHQTIEWERNLSGIKALFEYYGE